MADKRIDSVAFEEAIKEIASKMPKNIGDVGGVSWSDVKGRPTKVSELTNDVKYQTEAQVNATVKKVVGNAPAALDTLEEIAERLKEDGDAMTAINSILNDKANRSEIPTKYAGSSSAGGAATSANKLNANAGSETQPTYFKDGVPVACGHTLSKSVPADAVFTDTVYTTNPNSGILISSTYVITLDSAGTNRLGGIKTGYDAADQSTSMDYQYPGRTCPVKLDKNGNAYAIMPQKIPTDISALNNDSKFVTSDQANTAIQNAYTQACESAKLMIQTDAVRRVNGCLIPMGNEDAMVFNSNTGFTLYHFACKDIENVSDPPGYYTTYLARNNSLYIETVNYNVDEEGDFYFNNRKLATEEKATSLANAAKDNAQAYVRAWLQSPELVFEQNPKNLNLFRIPGTYFFEGDPSIIGCPVNCYTCRFILKVSHVRYSNAMLQEIFPFEPDPVAGILPVWRVIFNPEAASPYIGVWRTYYQGQILSAASDQTDLTNPGPLEDINSLSATTENKTTEIDNQES